MNLRQVGSLNEEKAADYLIQKGYKILARNFTIRGGEIDIVATEQDIIVFVEVKARFNSNYGLAREAITYYKMRALLKTAQVFLNKFKLNDREYRFDLVGIDVKDGTTYIEHIKNIEL
jgi:putative endonuclease